MKKTLILTCTVWICCSGQLFAHSAKKEVKKDDTMIQLDNQVRSLIVEQSDYDAALKVYASAARQHTDQPYYKEQYAVLRRVIKMKKAMEGGSMQGDMADSAAKKWTSYYQAVRGYYYDQGFYSESEKLDKTAAEKLKADTTTMNYLETLTILGKSEETQQLLAKSTDSLKADPGFAVLEHLMQARSDKTVDVSEVEKVLLTDSQANPRSFIYLGCIYQIQNNSKKACSAIKTALENTAPTQTLMTRKLIENMQEFDNLREDEKFLAAVQTESKVYQSGCTGGSSCNSCSLKDTCSSNQ